MRMNVVRRGNLSAEQKKSGGTLLPPTGRKSVLKATSILGASFRLVGYLPRSKSAVMVWMRWIVRHLPRNGIQPWSMVTRLVSSVKLTNIQ